MTYALKPIRSEAEYNAALAEVKRLWGARLGTPEGDRLDILATLIEVYESEHHPMDRGQILHDLPVVLSEAKELAVIPPKNDGTDDSPAPSFMDRTSARSFASLRTTAVR